MCNACGFLCCAHDGFRDCGCDDCEEEECWTRCEFCHHIKNHISDECTCGRDDDYDFGEDDLELAVNPVTGHVFQPEYEPEPEL